MRIVVADDDEAIRRLLALELRALGAEVFEASDGVEAVERTLEIQPDGVFLDVLMPGQSGYEALAQLRERGYDGRVVMVTALGSEGAQDLQVGVEPDDFIAKPFRHREVRACLERFPKAALKGAAPR